MTLFTDYIFDIVQNAINANASKLKIDIMKDHQLKLIIKDNGVGIHNNDLKRIISPFYTTRETRKVGLGLSLIILLTTLTDGSYNIKSSRLFGTKVTFTFNYHHIDFPTEGNYGLLIADIASNSQIKTINFSYKQKSQHMTYRYHKQPRSSIISDINNKITKTEVTYEIFKRT